MSKGTDKIVVRLRPALRAMIDAYLYERLKNPLVEPWTLSDFIRIAIADKMSHIMRSRKKGPKSVKPQVDNESVDLGTLPTSEEPESGINFGDLPHGEGNPS